MSSAPHRARTISPATARRLAVRAQRLSGHPADRVPGAADLLDVIRSIRCVQLDPIGVVARSHLLVPFSRLGPYPIEAFDTLLWEERSVFEYWAHSAAIVLTEDFPIHNLLMRRYPTDRYSHGRRTRAWLEENEELRRSMLRRLRAEGPLRSRDFEDQSMVGWESGGWTSGRSVERMLDVLWTQGRIMVVGRSGGQKLWAVADGWLPDWTPRARLTQEQVDRRAAEHALRALGVATPKHIGNHFIRGRYRTLPLALAGLLRSKRIHPVRVADGTDGGVEWPGRWFVHDDHLPTLEAFEHGDGWSPRTTLLSPFDNLVCDRIRTRQLFGFDYTVEIYVPPAKRRYGYYAMPLLHGDRLIGRVDPAMDRSSGRLTINSVHLEPGPARTREAVSVADGAIDDLAVFLGATSIERRSATGGRAARQPARKAGDAGAAARATRSTT